MNWMKKPIIWIVLMAMLATGFLFLAEYEPPKSRTALENFMDSLPSIIVITGIFTAIIYGFYAWVSELIAIEKEAKKG